LRQFLLTAADGRDTQPRDLAHQLDPAMAQSLRFQRYVPPPLLLIQPADQQVHLLMETLIRVIFDL
jgi:hypothetical protein